MKRTFPFLFIIFLLMAAGFTACDEVEEAGEYDNWFERNKAYTDSIHALAAERLFPQTVSGEEVDKVPAGQMFGLWTSASTDVEARYVYCKKIKADNSGVRPLITGSVSAYYYGTLINGATFDGNFDGYSAIDRGVLNPTEKAPTLFDSPAEFTVSGVISGWTWALQYMHEGERWILYIPYHSAYGESGSGSIPGYSTLAFDIVLDEVK